jgi:hypothetical protein
VSTFIVRFVRHAPDTFSGRVRHVATGEETGFSSPAELLAFMEEMNVVCGLSAVPGGHATHDGGGDDAPTHGIE